MGNPLNGVIFGTILVIVGLSTYVTGNGRDDPAWTITITFFVPAVNDGTTVLISVVEIMVLAKLTGTPSHVICNILLKFDPLKKPLNLWFEFVVYILNGHFSNVFLRYLRCKVIKSSAALLNNTFCRLLSCFIIVC